MAHHQPIDVEMILHAVGKAEIGRLFESEVIQAVSCFNIEPGLPDSVATEKQY